MGARPRGPPVPKWTRPITISLTATIASAASILGQTSKAPSTAVQVGTTGKPFHSGWLFSTYSFLASMEPQTPFDVSGSGAAGLGGKLINARWITNCRPLLSWLLTSVSSRGPSQERV